MFYSSCLDCRSFLRLLAVHAARFVAGGTPGTSSNTDPLKGFPFTAHYVNLRGQGCLKCKNPRCFGCAVPNDDRGVG